MFQKIYTYQGLITVNNQSKTVVCCDEDVFTVPERTQLSFQKTFTKTASDEKIVEEAGLESSYNAKTFMGEISSDEDKSVDKENISTNENRRLSAESLKSTDTNQSLASAGDMAAFNKRTLKQINGSPSKKRSSPSKRAFSSTNGEKLTKKTGKLVTSKKSRRHNPSPAKSIVSQYRKGSYRR